MSKISSFIGFFMALYLLPFVLVPVFFSKPPASNAAMMLGIVAYAVLTLACALVLKFIVTLLGVLATRGTAAVKWARPGQGTAIGKWLGECWSGYTDEGYRRGFRVLGLEVRIAGC